ncbi:aspartate ammonia-lyase [Streptacidiphilus carbonis]|uniref:aspartate ammonia-lyase n=1 Tax=Streptacidiphilus carbonis TaxID=105422 RepID=UPI0009FEB937|nr:aspartate ammonia-lyase [Streptacidiphilus carbonis]
MTAPAPTPAPRPIPHPTSVAGPHRTEHDLLGDREVPADAYYGVHTLRAVENFPITGTPISVHPELVVALACVKQAAAQANHELGLLDRRRADAVVRACQEIRAGRLHDAFVVDVIQGGAGTSTNMNANEVIANRALELLGHPRGHYGELHPLEHVNLSQSTNDAYPTAVRIALQIGARQLRTALTGLADAFSAKAAEFAPMVKMGRTQLQDAVPMTLGQEFGAFAVTIREDVERLTEACGLLLEINLGGTAVGTGLNAPDRYAATVCAQLCDLTGLPLSTAADLVEATWDVGAFVQLSGVLKRIAVKLSKICNDLRLLSSGPRTGLGEISLPAVQAGSSIMPGKVNPVIPEAVNQVAFRVIGHDTTVTMAAEAGQLQLNAFEPVIAHSLLDSLSQLGSACRTLTERCVAGITADPEHLRRNVDRSIGTVTALNPFIGYTAAGSVAAEALATGRGVRELVLERGLLTVAQLDELLRPENLAFSTRPVAGE